MTEAVQRLIDSFDALPEADKYLAVVELLRRAPTQGDLSEQTLTETADELFRALDAEEASDATG